MKKPLPARWLITDTKRIDAVAAAKKLPKNSGVILRDYDLGFDARLALGKKLKKIAREKKIIFLVALDAKLALALHADGIHFPEFAAQEIRKWRKAKPQWIITASTHSRHAVKNAYEFGADAVLISPIFPTISHPGAKTLGITLASHYIYRGLPAYGLGGLQPKHEKALRMAGFKGLAGISWGEN